MISRLEYIRHLSAWLGKPVIKVLTGMRRVGKSSLLLLLKEELGPSAPVFHLNMELMENDGLREAEAFLKAVKSAFPRPSLENLLLVDEVQDIHGWERAVASLQAESFCDIVLTGSNASLFSGELASRIAGRFVVIPVFPLSYSEFLSFRGLPGNKADEGEFYRWLRWGGLPGLHHLGFADDAESIRLREEYLRSIVDTVLLKDVVMRNQVRDPAFLSLLLRYVCDNTGRIFSAKSVSDWCRAHGRGVSVETVQSYIRFLGDAQLIHSLPRADLQGKRHLAYHEKLYLADTGLRHALLGYRADDISVLLENVVLTELLRRGWSVRVGQTGEREIDFIADRGAERLYVQVSYLLAGPETVERELRPLEAVGDSHPKLLLSMDRSPFAGRGGIQHRYLPEWLMEEGA